MLLQEYMNLVVFVNLSTTPLKVLHPIETRILHFWRKVLLYFILLYICNMNTRIIPPTDTWTH
jgi:hypothetical protein